MTGKKTTKIKGDLYNAKKVQVGLDKKVTYLDGKNAQYKEAAKYLVSYHQYLPINQQHDQQTIFNKKQFYNQHRSELLAFEHALKQLEKLSINTTVNPEKVVELVKQQTGQISELQARYKRCSKK